MTDKAGPEENKVKLLRTAKGKRPQYFSDPATDKLLAMMMNLLGEFSVMRDRLDTVERLLETRKIMDVADVETYKPSPEAEQQRSDRRDRIIRRVLKPVQADLEEATKPGRVIETEPERILS
jgi:hypothetical protein